jgi:hypothetical protein
VAVEKLQTDLGVTADGKVGAEIIDDGGDHDHDAVGARPDSTSATALERLDERNACPSTAEAPSRRLKSGPRWRFSVRSALRSSPTGRRSSTSFAWCSSRSAA